MIVAQRSRLVNTRNSWKPKASSGSPSDVVAIKNIRDYIGIDSPSLQSLVPLRLERELRTIICGLGELNLIGVGIIEVAPIYDTNAELSTIAVPDALYEVLSIMGKKGSLSIGGKSCICPSLYKGKGI
ncbi:Ribosomal protein L6, conserved site [Penicillium camemberti]|uniref:Ribosomal protein L6, conserved site n=1 Tax=Penicillium camemberti (strain FM 013) TaxID=1429867 RepID=A0A0G4PHC8_PENC3|nr:Ribosomal protein L6, conserved site [Penicillium camemberti]